MIATLAAWIPFVYPLTLPPGARLWMFLPLAACIAVVYRATRSETPEHLLRSSVVTFFSIVIGMVVIAAGAYVLNEVVIRFGSA